MPLEETPEGLLTPCEAGGGGGLGQSRYERVAFVALDLNPSLTVDALGVKLVVPQSCPAFSVARRCLWTGASTAADLGATLRAGPVAQSLQARGVAELPGGSPPRSTAPASSMPLRTASALYLRCWHPSSLSFKGSSCHDDFSGCCRSLSPKSNRSLFKKL